MSVTPMPHYNLKSGRPRHALQLPRLELRTFIAVQGKVTQPEIIRNNSWINRKHAWLQVRLMRQLINSCMALISLRILYNFSGNTPKTSRVPTHPNLTALWHACGWLFMHVHAPYQELALSRSLSLTFDGKLWDGRPLAFWSSPSHRLHLLQKQDRPMWAVSGSGTPGNLHSLHRLTQQCWNLLIVSTRYDSDLQWAVPCRGRFWWQS